MTGPEATVEEEIWRRAFWKPGGGDAFLYYVVFGQFPPEVRLDAARYRIRQVPDWLELHRLMRAEHGEHLAGYYSPPFMDRPLEELAPDTVTSIQTAPECLVLRGEIADPSSLLYLRDAVGSVMALLDQGGVAVLDLQTLTWRTPEQWREYLWMPDDPQLHEQAAILVSEDEEAVGRLWFHTRGLRKFGRPDISVRSVPPEVTDAATELCNRFIRLLARGHLISEGQPVRLAGLPDGMTCHHAGSLDDPDFNNVHVQVRYPG